MFVVKFREAGIQKSLSKALTLPGIVFTAFIAGTIFGTAIAREKRFFLLTAASQNFAGDGTNRTGGRCNFSST
jgi:hypothetical protein